MEFPKFQCEKFSAVGFEPGRETIWSPVQANESIVLHSLATLKDPYHGIGAYALDKRIAFYQCSHE